MKTHTSINLLRHRLRNWLQSVLLIGGLLWVVSASASFLFGADAVPWLLFTLGLMLLFAPRLSPWLLLRIYRARPLNELNAPELTAIVAELARRAELPYQPMLFYIPSSIPNAFATGTGKNTVVGVTDALLRLLDQRELIAVLAHEISHLRHKDTWIMGLADLLGRLTWSMSWLGQFLLLVNLPLLLIGGPMIPWQGVLLLIFAPHISALLQLAMSRTREYDADLGSVELTGHPEWLISALRKMEHANRRSWERILMPDSGGVDPSLLRTHPPTEKRIQRLRELQPPRQRLPFDLELSVMPPFERIERPASRHWGGLWY